MHFDDLMNTYRNHIENYLRKILSPFDSEPQKTLFDAMQYSLLAGGKRLRPIFVYDFCRMCGGNWENAAPFAAAVEMIHTYSLIHDDLPCMDNDDFRRGNPTNHKVFGEAIAVLAGDALLTSAFTQLSIATYPSDIRIKAVEELSVAAGELGMVGGQVLDIQSEERQCTKQEVIDIQSRKTGALIQASCVLGVLAGEGDTSKIDAARHFASHIGLAFQIRDDILDVIGDSKQLGKSVGTDSNKNTFVHLYGLEACDSLVRSHTEEAINALYCFENPEYMISLAKNLTNRIS